MSVSRLEAGDNSRFSFSKKESKSPRTSIVRNVQSENVGLEAADSLRFGFLEEESESSQTSIARNVQSENIGLEAADSSRFGFSKEESKNQRKIENSFSSGEPKEFGSPDIFFRVSCEKNSLQKCNLFLWSDNIKAEGNEGGEEMEAAVVSELVDQYGADVMRFCRKLTLCSIDAEDLYQQTFLKLMEMKINIRKEENPRALLFAVANGIWKNECRKLLRRAHIAPSVSISQMEEEERQPSDEADTQKQVLGRMQREALLAAVQRLEMKYRIPILLMYSFGMKVDEIARVEHLPRGTVKSRLNRARKQLRREMEERGYGTEE